MKGWSGVTLIVAGGILAIAALFYLTFAPVEADHASAETHHASARGSREAIASPKIADTGGKTPSVRRESPASAQAQRKTALAGTMPEDWYAKLPEADRALGRRLQDAQDAANRSAILTAAEEALRSKSTEVRQAAVDALSLQGEAAIPLLRKYLSDADADVVTSAYHAWDSAIDGIGSELDRMKNIEEALPLIRDGDQLQGAVEKFVMMDRARAIRKLAALAEDGDRRISDAAKRSYENLIGEEYENRATAMLKAIAVERDSAE